MVSMWNRNVTIPEKEGIMMFEQYDDILTVEEVAEILKIGMTQAYKIVRSGSLKGYKEGKDWKIPKQALKQYVLSQICL